MSSLGDVSDWPDCAGAYAASLVRNTTLTDEQIVRHTKRAWGTERVRGAIAKARENNGNARQRRNGEWFDPRTIEEIENESPALDRINAAKVNDRFTAAIIAAADRAA